MRQRKQSGFSLLELVLVCCIAMILASVALPSFVKLAEAGVQDAAAQQLGAINSAEFSYAYVRNCGTYTPFANLVGVGLSQAISCANPMLLSGAAIQPPSGYTFNPPPTFTATGYVINLQPNNPKQRYFFTCGGASCANPATDSQVITFAQGRQALESDPAYAAATPNGSGTGSSPVGSSAGVTIWNSGANYIQGDAVLRATSIGGDSCTETGQSAPYVGLWVNITGTNTDPCANNAGNWYFTGSQAPLYTPAPPPPSLCGYTQSGSIPAFQTPTQPASSETLLITGICGTYTNTQINISTNPLGGTTPTLNFEIEDTTNGQQMTCGMQAFTSSARQCNGSGSIVIATTDQVVIVVYWGLTPNVQESFPAPVELSWAMSP